MSRSTADYLRHIIDELGVDYDIVGDVIDRKLPSLRDEVERLLTES